MLYEVITYRLGMLAAGAGALFMAETISWDKVYLFMASLVSVGMIAVMFSRRIGADKSTKDVITSYSIHYTKLYDC